MEVRFIIDKLYIGFTFILRAKNAKSKNWLSIGKLLIRRKARSFRLISGVSKRIIFFLHIAFGMVIVFWTFPDLVLISSIISSVFSSYLDD